MSPRAPHLSLVPTCEPAPDAPPVAPTDAIRPRARAVADLPPAALRLRHQTLEWALATARPADADALSAILARKIEMEGPPLRFTEADVFELLWHGVVNWCTVRGASVPPAVAETLWTLLDRLEVTRAYAEGSDSLSRLRRPLLTGGGLGPDGTARVAAGTRRRHPSGRVTGAG